MGLLDSPDPIFEEHSDVSGRLTAVPNAQKVGAREFNNLRTFANEVKALVMDAAKGNGALDTRVTTAEGTLSPLPGQMTAVEARATALEGRNAGSINAFEFIPSQYHAGIEAGTSSVDVFGWCRDAALEAAESQKPLVLPAGGFNFSDEIPAFQGMTVKGSGRPGFGAVKGTRIFQTTPGKACFTLGNSTHLLTISDMAMYGPKGAGTYGAGSYAVNMAGAYPNSSTAHVFRNILFAWWERAISAVGTGGWQIDNCVVDHCTFSENLHGIWQETPNANNWQIRDSSFYSILANGTGITVKSGGGYVVNSFAGGVNDTDTCFVRIDGPLAKFDMKLCQAEQIGEYLDVTANVSSYLPIVLDGCVFDEPVNLRGTCQVISIGNRISAPVNLIGNDIVVNSFGDYETIPTPFVVTGIGSRVMNRIAMQGGATPFPANILSGRKETRASDPSTIDGEVGDFVWNTEATGPAGWRCTTAGSPGTWTPIADRASSRLALPYASGKSAVPEADRFSAFSLSLGANDTVEIQAPTGGVDGKVIQFWVFNGSGGALTGVTWNAIYKFAGALPLPATDHARFVSFIYDGTRWMETSRSAADVIPW